MKVYIARYVGDFCWSVVLLDCDSVEQARQIASKRFEAVIGHPEDSFVLEVREATEQDLLDALSLGDPERIYRLTLTLEGTPLKQMDVFASTEEEAYHKAEARWTNLIHKEGCTIDNHFTVVTGQILCEVI